MNVMVSIYCPFAFKFTAGFDTIGHALLLKHLSRYFGFDGTAHQ